MKEQFSQECREEINHYVYALLDPRNGSELLQSVFYIGKGEGDRCYHHANSELHYGDLDERQLKLSTIRAIRKETGHPPRVTIVAHGLKNDEDASRLEALLIAALNPLTNAVKAKGDRDLWIAADELDARYSKPLSRESISERLLLVSLNGGPQLVPYPKIPAADLAGRTLGAWPISERKARNVDYVVGVYRGLTRCVYKVCKDEDGHSVFSMTKATAINSRRRARFEGSLDESKEQWLLHRIVNKEGKTLTKFDPQSSVRFLDV